MAFFAGGNFGAQMRALLMRGLANGTIRYLPNEEQQTQLPPVVAPPPIVYQPSADGASNFRRMPFRNMLGLFSVFRRR